MAVRHRVPLRAVHLTKRRAGGRGHQGSSRPPVACYLCLQEAPFLTSATSLLALGCTQQRDGEFQWAGSHAVKAKDITAALLQVLLEAVLFAAEFLAAATQLLLLSAAAFAHTCFKIASYEIKDNMRDMPGRRE